MNNKKWKVRLLPSAMLLLILSACNNNSGANTNAEENDNSVILKGTYAYDVNYLKEHTKKAIELMSSDSSARVLLSADYQGRVMTSSAMGDDGASFGWLNYDLIAASEKKKQFNAVGGEERFWLGPEGGQYALYFKGGDSFNIARWQVPAFIDTVSYDVAQADNSSAVFTKDATLTNYSGTNFSVNIKRTITLLNKDAIALKLGAEIPESVHTVGFETNNTLTNTGNSDWQKNKGLLSIWLLGMFTPTPRTTVIIPFHPIPNARSYITDNYFGEIPADRLQVKDSVLFFKCDGNFRSKIGLSPKIAKPIAAGFDFEKNVLTIVLPQVDPNASYVNSKWELQKEPYKGDVINSYNDGPLADGTQMGPFLEIESSSPALQLKKGESASYKQSTIHLQGDYNALRQITQQLLNVDLDSLKTK